MKYLAMSLFTTAVLVICAPMSSTAGEPVDFDQLRRENLDKDAVSFSQFSQDKADDGKVDFDKLRRENLDKDAVDFNQLSQAKADDGKVDFDKLRRENLDKDAVDFNQLR